MVETPRVTQMLTCSPTLEARVALGGSAFASRSCREWRPFQALIEEHRDCGHLDLMSPTVIWPGKRDSRDSLVMISGSQELGYVNAIRMEGTRVVSC